ncbi:hypothetical protein [uncultured Kordia sp.]|uniref:hypothetical protein n=1 Tax=uncultured Kordia sp. TaxID=507699 RepID=UPI0026345AEB|nr:hypothetical protein [uncultured Kordia sp.]
MNKKKRVLQFKKFKIANLKILSVSGGTDSFPCHNTNPNDQTQGNSCYCNQAQSYPYECTVFAGRTDIRNGCTKEDQTDTTQNGSQVSG